MADGIALAHRLVEVGTRAQVAADRVEVRVRRQRMPREGNRLVTAPGQRTHDRRAEVAAAAGDQDAQHADMLTEMFSRQKTGSVVCASCGSLVGVNDEQCYSCGRRNPGLWGFGPVLRRFGNDMGFVTLVVYGCSILYALTLIATVALGGSVLSPAI